MGNRDRIDRFDEQARQALQHAQEEAQRLQHTYIGTEHLLLGLVHDSNNVASTIVRNIGVDLVKVRSAVEFILSRRPVTVKTEPGLTPRAKKVIELAVDEARRLQHHYIGTEHLLLGMIREGEGIAAGVLESLGINLEKARTETIRTLYQKAQSAPNVPASIQSEQLSNIPSLETTETIQPRTEVVVQTQSIRPYDGYPFTEQAHKIIKGAREEALRLDHNYIGTEHLLLGMLRADEGVAGAVLHNLGVQFDRVRKAVVFIIGYGDRYVSGEIGLTPRSKKLLELASKEAQSMNNTYVGTEHLLLALVVEGEGIAAGVLNSLGVGLNTMRTETLRVLQNAKHEE